MRPVPIESDGLGRSIAHQYLEAISMANISEVSDFRRRNVDAVTRYVAEEAEKRAGGLVRKAVIGIERHHGVPSRYMSSKTQR
jgi:hypothetical protein